MTTPKGLLSKSFIEEPVARIIERGPWANYARCNECGVDAGKACRDEDDKEALEVCDGRRLVVVDAYQKCKAYKPGREKTQRHNVAKRKGASPPIYVPCEHCGQSVRLWGQGIVQGKGWCSTMACYRARKSAQSKVQYKKKAELKTAEIVAHLKDVAPTCNWCGAMISWRRTSPLHCCTDVACRRFRSREMQRRRRAKAKIDAK